MYNALLFISRNAVPIARKDKVDSRSQMVEESTDYRGYTNPNVQSRSFKIIQQSLSVEEAEEGTFEPSGAIPGEMIVVRAYNEGKKRMAELSETHPRNFASIGMPSFKGRAAYYGIDDEFDEFDKAQKFRESGGGKDAQESVTAKRFEGTQSTPRQRQPAQNTNAQPQYKVLSDDIDVTDSVLSPHVQGRRPMAVKLVSNEQQAVQPNVGTAQTQRVQHVSHSHAGVNVQQQAPVRNDVRMTHVQNISAVSPPQAPANIQRTQQVVQQNARPMNIQTSAVTQQSQKQMNYDTNTQVMSQNYQAPAPSVLQPNAAVIQSQTKLVQASAFNQQPQAPPPLNIMHVEKAPAVVAPPPAAPKEEAKSPANRRVRPTRAEAKAAAMTEAKTETVEIQQTSSTVEESKTIAEAPDVDQEVSKQAESAVVKLEQATEADQKSETKAEIENKTENITEKENIEVASEEATTSQVVEEKEVVQEQTMEAEGKSVNETQQAASMEPASIAQENEPPTKTLEPPTQIQEEPTPTDSLQTLPTPEASESTTANEIVEVVKETEAKEPSESEVEAKPDINENTESASFENDLNLKTESESKNEIVETVAQTVEISEETSQKDVTESVSVESSSIQAAENENKIEVAEQKETAENEISIEASEARSNIEMSVVTDNAQQITVESTSENQTQNTEESQSFTLKLEDDIKESAVDISVDSTEFVIDTTNIEITGETDTTSVEANEAVVDLNIVSEDKSNVDNSADINLSLNEETVVIGLTEETSSEQVSVQNDEAVEFSISFSEETASDNIDTKTEEKINEKASEQTADAVSDKDVKNKEESAETKVHEKESEDKKETKEVSNKEEKTKEEVSADKKESNEVAKKKSAKSEEDKAQSKTENNKPKSKVSAPQSDKDDKKSAPWRTRKTNFVDSQGGVAARLQRLQKK